MAKRKPVLSIFVVAMLNIAIVMSLRGLPMIAKEGLPLCFYVLFASLFFLVPISLVTAELGTAWPEGGVYRWVKEAFGPRWGFLAIWLQWIQNTIWYSTGLAFAGGTLAYIFFDPLLAESKVYTVAVILVIYWIATFVNLRGLRASSIASTVLVIVGGLLPALVIILFGLAWYFGGSDIEFLKGNPTIFPDFTDFDRIAFLSGTIVLFSGIEVGAIHASSMKNPKKDYPKAVFISLGIIFFVYAVGSLVVASIVPNNMISLTAGIMEALNALFLRFHIDWALPVIGSLILCGNIATVIAWIGGPSKGLLETAKAGELPPFFQYTNKNGVQQNILWVQGIIVSLLACTYLVMRDVDVAFFLLTALVALLYMLMYLLLFVSAIRLRYTHPKLHREYKIPGGNWGMWICSVLGIIAVLIGISLCFFPPSQLEVEHTTLYISFIFLGGLICIGAPLLISAFKSAKWKPKK